MTDNSRIEEWRKRFIARLIERGCTADLAQDECDGYDDPDIIDCDDPEGAADDTIDYIAEDSDGGEE